jgi:hypothetical protein
MSAPAAAVREHEDALIALCQAPDFTLEKLRQFLASQR